MPQQADLRGEAEQNRTASKRAGRYCERYTLTLGPAVANGELRLMRYQSILLKMLNIPLKRIGVSLVLRKDMLDWHLHKYSSYEEYVQVQIHWNKVKINRVWADEATLIRVKDILVEEFGVNNKIKGICHGVRNGYEQNFLRCLSDNIEVIGTDISETAKNFDNSIQWDFHNANDAWLGNQDFIYTNSLDQSWQPHVAVQTWLSQLKPNGLLIIEHSEVHGPTYASEMDPFGVRPIAMPYVLTMWFGSQISISHSVAKKSNMSRDSWLFVIRKNANQVGLIKNESVLK